MSMISVAHHHVHGDSSDEINRVRLESTAQVRTPSRSLVVNALIVVLIFLLVLPCNEAHTGPAHDEPNVDVCEKNNEACCSFLMSDVFPTLPVTVHLSDAERTEIYNQLEEDELKQCAGASATASQEADIVPHVHQLKEGPQNAKEEAASFVFFG